MLDGEIVVLSPWINSNMLPKRTSSFEVLIAFPASLFDRTTNVIRRIIHKSRSQEVSHLVCTGIQA